jgi:hypothetical protein
MTAAPRAVCIAGAQIVTREDRGRPCARARREALRTRRLAHTQPLSCSVKPLAPAVGTPENLRRARPRAAQHARTRAKRTSAAMRVRAARRADTRARRHAGGLHIAEMAQCVEGAQ